MDIRNLVCILYPERCACCGRVIEIGDFLCEYCACTLPIIKRPVCFSCGANKEACGCKNEKNGYDAITTPFYYSGVISQAIRDFKFNSKKYIYRFLAFEMSECIKERYADERFDLICCVPMTNKKCRERGYNQSRLLAREIGKILCIEYCDLLIKLYDTPQQHGLRADERKGNVIGVFDVNEKININGRKILLCDDIKTTGATLGECAKILKLAGADEVKCIVAAITPFKKEQNKEDSRP